MANSKNNRAGAVIAVILAFLLTVVFRVDWWWGQETPLIFGWMNIRMIYYIAVWAAGYALVFYTVYRLWEDPENKND